MSICRCYFLSKMACHNHQEASAGVRAGHSVRHHLLTAYRRSMLAIMLAQFTRKGFAHGQAGVAELAAGSPLVQVNSSSAWQQAASSHCRAVSSRLVDGDLAGIVLLQTNMLGFQSCYITLPVWPWTHGHDVMFTFDTSCWFCRR